MVQILSGFVVAHKIDPLRGCSRDCALTRKMKGSHMANIKNGKCPGAIRSLIYSIPKRLIVMELQQMVHLSEVEGASHAVCTRPNT